MNVFQTHAWSKAAAQTVISYNKKGVEVNRQLPTYRTARPGAAAMMLEGATHEITYFKRFRMEIDLTLGLPAPALPPGYCWLAWDPALVEAHAEVKFLSFADEIDSIVFPNLGCRSGCRQLMEAIARRSGFEPQATWLIACGDDLCGTVQGVRELGGIGAIQNLGVVPHHRGLRLGTALLLQALHGLRHSGMARTFLEVTAQNESAIRLYRRLGFRCRKTIYKAVDTTSAANIRSDAQLAAIG
jgi:ribosomal protein S18 acetylase RimI-like enzyme